MASVQVLDRQMDPTLQGAIATRNSVTEAIKSRQAFEIAKKQYALQLKQATSEEEKLALEKQIKRMDFLKEVKEIADPGHKAAMLKMGSNILWNGPDDMMQGLGYIQSDIAKIAQDLGGGPDEATQSQLRGAQVNQANADANLSNKSAALFGGAPGGATNGADRASAMQNSYVVPDATVKGIHLVNPQVQQETEAGLTTAKANATREGELKPLRASVDNYLSTFDAASKEAGTSSYGAGAAVKGAVGVLTSPFKKDSAVASVIGLKKPIGLAVGAFINRGKPTDKDAVAGEDLLPQVGLPERTNRDRSNNLKSLMSSSGSPQDIYNKAAALSQKNKSEQAFIEKALAEGHTQAEVDSYLSKMKGSR